MAISLVGVKSSFAGSSGTSVTGTQITETINANDVIVAGIINNTQATITVAPSGYTSIGRYTDSTTLAIDLYYKVAAGGDGNVTATLSAASKWIVNIGVYRGVDTTTPVAAQNGVGEPGTATAHVTPTVSNPDAANWAVCMWADRGGTAATWTADAALLERLDTATTSTSQVSSLMADSNGTVTSGNHSYTGTSTFSGAVAVSWLGYLTAAAGAAAAAIPNIAMAMTVT
jgi:hypothetical protein